MEMIEDLLKKYWGYTSFLPHQKEIIESVIDGKDTLAILATGAGKSLCYQLPSVYFGGLTLVISPLISLMKDQVDDLNAKGIPSAAYNSTLDYQERDAIESDLKSDNIRLLFVSPEKCMQSVFLDYLKILPIRLIAIDEAHCISEWGHDFRKEYRQLAILKKQFPEIPVIALTATAIPQVRRDIKEQLGLTGSNEFIGSFNRKNLHYRVVPKRHFLQLLLNYVGQHRDDSGIIYCFSKQETEDLAEELSKQGFKARAYHAGLPKMVRETVQNEFIHDNIKIICATIAFGMGINKPDVRYVIHYDLPKSIESYYQESGRAGRDGLAAECLLFYNRRDANRVRALLQNDDSDERQVLLSLRKLQDVIDYCESPSCRRKFLLNYFGEQYSEENCGSCDNCGNPRDQIDGTEIAKRIIECVKQLPTSFGTVLITDILTGKISSKISQHQFDKLPAFNSGKDHSKKQYQMWINELIHQNYLSRDEGMYPVIHLTPKSETVLNEQSRVMLSQPEPEGRMNRFDMVSSETPGELMPDDEKLLLRLKKIRKTIADRDKVPPYVVFHDKSLREMAQIKPLDNESFKIITGVGERKLKKYGPEFIPAIKTFCDDGEYTITKKEDLYEPESSNTLEKIFEIDQEIENLNYRIKELTVDKKKLLDYALSATLDRQGKYSLHRSVSHVRQLDLEAFKLQYPQVFMKIGSVKLGEADQIIGKAEVSKLCSVKESVSYKVVEVDVLKE